MIQHFRHSLACRRRRHASTLPAISVQRQALGHLHHILRTPPPRPRRPHPGLITSSFAVHCIQIAADAADGTEGAGVAAVGAAADGPQRISMFGGGTGGTISRKAAALRRRRSGRQQQQQRREVRGAFALGPGQLCNVRQRTSPNICGRRQMLSCRELLMQQFLVFRTTNE